MSLKRYSLFFLACFLFSYSLFADCSLFLGPEVYHAKRTRKGGSEQAGCLYGGRIKFERIRPRSLYLEASAAYATGELRGHTGNGRPLRSRMQDKEIEGRLGYSLFKEGQVCASFIPYIGYGYFSESNRFARESPLNVLFIHRFPYLTAGFLLSIQLAEQWRAGIDFKTKYILSPRCKIEEKGQGNTRIPIGEEWQYEAEMPLVYTIARRWQGELAPFYRFRHYGGKMKYPFDFLETKIRIYGARASLAYQF